ncbi:hypothetical protein J6590_079024 [Homalodisca vitripennis]|nr:hypothetical protein J6590_079024 [Homalodisca vitripennis]
MYCRPVFSTRGNIPAEKRASASSRLPVEPTLGISKIDVSVTSGCYYVDVQERHITNRDVEIVGFMGNSIGLASVEDASWFRLGFFSVKGCC